MQSHALVLELMNLVGWRYDQIKSPLPAETFWLLGVDHCLGLQAVVWVCEEKINKLWRQVQYHRRCGRVTAADASALHGSFNWIRSSLWGRCGAAILTPLRTRQRSGRFAGMNSALLAMLSWLEYALMYENGQSLPCEIAKLPLVVTVSDDEGTGNVAVAMWETSAPEERPRITPTKVPERLLSKWALHASNTIASIEGIGPLLALATWPQLDKKLWI